MTDLTHTVSFSQGFVFCTPGGVMLPHTYRRTEAEVIGAVFTNPDERDQHWAQAQAVGSTIQFVYARIFTPAYFAAEVLRGVEQEKAA